MAFKMKSGKEGPMRKNFPSAFKAEDDDLYEVVKSTKEGGSDAVYNSKGNRINLPEEDKPYQAWKLRQEQAADQKREKEVEIEERTDVQNF